MITHLKLKNPDRGFSLLKTVPDETIVWDILMTDGFRAYIESHIIEAINLANPDWPTPIETIAEARKEDPYTDVILNYLYEIQATNECSIADMLIHRPVILIPEEDEILERADFLIELEKYVSGLYHTGEHTATDWEVSVNDNMQYPSFFRYSSPELITMLTTGLLEDTVYYIRARFHSNEMRSRWSDIRRITTGIVRSLILRTKYMALFCNTEVTVQAQLVGGKGSDHTLEWEQRLEESNVPLVWNWGQYGSLQANYSVETFEDVFLRLVVDRGTKYENSYDLNVYRGGIEFQDYTSRISRKDIVNIDPPPPTVVMKEVKHYEIESYTSTRDNDDMWLFWIFPWHYGEEYAVLYEQEEDTTWTEIFRSSTITNFPVGFGTYKLMMFDPEDVSYQFSPAYTIAPNDDWHIHHWIRYSYSPYESGLENYIVFRLEKLDKDDWGLTDWTYYSPKYEAAVPDYIEVHLEVIAMEAADYYGYYSPKHKPTIENYTVVLLDAIEIG